MILFAATIIVCILSVNGTSIYCPDGEEVNKTTDSCQTCKEGLFRHGDMSVCQEFKTCTSKYQAVRFPGNKTHNVVCYCPYEPFTVIMGDQCHATCPAGKYFIALSCQPCPPEKWKNFTGPEGCLSCTQCSKILYECNSTHDAVCATGELTTESNKNNGSADGNPSADASSSNPGPIIGIVIGVIVSVIVGVGVVVCCLRKRKKRKSRSSESSDRPSPHEVKPLVPLSNGDRNQSNASANSQDTSTNHQRQSFPCCCLPRPNSADAGSSHRRNESQQHKNSNLEDASKPNETPGQPVVELNREVDPSVVVNPPMASASFQHTGNPGPQQNGDQNELNANADSQDTSTNQQRTHDSIQQNGNNPNNAGAESNPEVVPPAVDSPLLSPEHDPGPQQNLNPNQPTVNDLQVNRPTSSASIQPKPGPPLNLNPNQSTVNDLQVNRPTSSASLQPNPALNNEGQPSSLCTNPLLSISSNNNVSFPGVAAAQTTPSFEASQDNVDLRLRDERLSTTGRLSSSSQPRTSAVPEDLWDYEDCITNNYNYIRTYLTSLGYILGSLLQDRIFTHPQMLEIKEIERNKSKGDAIDKMIELMRLKGNRGFECFIKALVIPDVRLDKVAHDIHPQLAERFINERESEDTEDQDIKTESPRKASSEGKDEVDFGKSRADETKIKTVGSDETHIKATGLDETKMKTIDSDETKIKIIDSDVTKIKTVDSDVTKIKTVD